MKKKHMVVAVSLGLTQLALLTQAGHAQGAKEKKDTVKNLNEVVISATKANQKQSQTGKVVTIISHEQLDCSAGKTVAELLNEQAGVIVNGAGSNPGKDKSLYLRGASSQYTLILLDGIIVSDPSGNGGAFDLRLFPIDQIDHIEILKGGQSTLYGSAAVAGVINIVTKKDAQPGLNLSGVATGGNYSTFKQSVGANSREGILSFNVNYTHEKTNGISEAAMPPGASDFDKDGYNEHAVNANFAIQASDKLKISPFVRYLYGNYNYDNGAFADANNFNEAKHFNTGARVTYVPSNKLSFNLNYNYENTKRNYVSGAYGPSPFNGRINFADLYLNYNASKYVKVLLGADDRYAQSTTSGDALDVSAKQFSAYTSVFVNDLISFFNLEAGTRYNKHSVYGDNWTYSVTPSFNIIGTQLRVFGTVSTSFSAPDLGALYGKYGANPNLLPEKSTSYEAGVSTSEFDNRFKLRVVGFSRKVTDAIVYTSHYINQDEQDGSGIEVEPSYTTDKFNISSFYTYFNGYTLSGPSLVRTDGILRRPKNVFGLSAGVHATQKLFVSANFRTYSSRGDAYFDMNTFTTKSVTLDAYNLFDTYAEYAVAGKKLKFFVDVKNIFNTQYFDVYGYNTMGTNFNAGLSFNIR